MDFGAFNGRCGLFPMAIFGFEWWWLPSAIQCSRSKWAVRHRLWRSNHLFNGVLQSCSAGKWWSKCISLINWFCRYILLRSINCVRHVISPFNLPIHQIHVKLLEGRPGMKSKVTPTTVLDFTLARFVRLRFQGMHTTQQSVNGIQWIFDSDELKKRSFYSLRYIKIGARLDCNGHAHQPKQYNDDEVSRWTETKKKNIVIRLIETIDWGIDCDLNWKSMLLPWFIRNDNL